VLSGDGRDPVSLSQLKWRRLRLDAIGPQDLQPRSRKRGLACSCSHDPFFASVATLMGLWVEFYAAKERYEQLRRTARACDDAAVSPA
jgi:hypothetical protein